MVVEPYYTQRRSDKKYSQVYDALEAPHSITFFHTRYPKALKSAFAIIEDVRRVRDAKALEALRDEHTIFEAEDLGMCSDQVLIKVAACLKETSPDRFLRSMGLQKHW